MRHYRSGLLRHVGQQPNIRDRRIRPHDRRGLRRGEAHVEETDRKSEDRNSVYENSQTKIT